MSSGRGFQGLEPRALCMLCKYVNVSFIYQIQLLSLRLTAE